MVHAIRLREPWVLARPVAGHLELRRQFQCPPALLAAAHVWLTATGLPPVNRVTINGLTIDPGEWSASGIRYDIRALLRPSNEILISLPLDDSAAGAIEELVGQVRRDVLAAGLVRLEIE